jgi:hypothetical protein
MSVDHTFIVLDTSGHQEAIHRALLDFIDPFTVMCSEPTRLITRSINLDGGKVGNVTSYQGGDIKLSIEGIPTPIHNKRCHQILLALLHEGLTQSVNYLEVTEPDLAIAAAMFDISHPDHRHVAALNQFFTHPIIDVLLNDITNHMALVRNEPWREWHLMESNGFYVLLGGRDHRVVEWERMTQMPNDNGTTYEFDMNSLMQYLGTQYTTQHRLGVIGIDGVRHVIFDALTHLLPAVDVPKSPRTIDYRLDPQYLEFMSVIVEPAVSVFINTTIRHLISSRIEGPQTAKFAADITLNGVFVLTALHPSLSDEERERYELMTAIDNQDFVPERLRRQHNL